MTRAERKAMSDAAEVLEEQARTAEGRLVGAESDPDCDEQTIRVLKRDAAKWRDPADALRAALALPPAPSMEEIERLVRKYGTEEWAGNDAKAEDAKVSLLSAIRALPDRWAEGWEAGREAGARISEDYGEKWPGSVEDRTGERIAELIRAALPKRTGGRRG